MRRLLSITFALSMSVTAALTVAPPVALAAETPVSGGTLNLIVQPEPPSLMIGITTNGPALLVGGNIYESLLRYDEHLKPMPSLADSWEISKDGMVYTFHLRHGVKWHDGKPMTSADVMFTVQDFLMKMQPRHRNLMSHVAKVEAPDDYTVVFTLKEPFEAFIRGFSFYTMPIVPKHIYAGTDFRNNPANDTPIGTGPFKFGEWKRGSYIKLVKNPDYYIKGKPYLDALYYQIIPDGASRAVAYETGKVQVLPGGSVENFDIPRLSKLDNSCTTEKGWEYFAPHSWLWLNNRKPPMNNVKFRQAVMYAMDRDFAKDVLWNGYGKVASGPFSSRMPFFDKVEPQYPHDPDKAKALLKEMGYDGTPLKLLPLPYGETWQRWAEAVKQNLGDVGIPVEIESTDVAGWNQKISQWDYDIAFTYLYQNGDPAIGIDRNYKSSQISKGNPFNNVEGYSNPEVDDLFAKAAVAYPSEKRQELYTEVQKKLQADVPVAWLLELSFPTIYNCNIHDLVTTSVGLDNSLRDTWISK